MNDIGINISGQRSKQVNEYRDILFDIVVTVCDKVKEICPICRVSLKAPGTTPAARETIHKSFKDPAAAEGSREDQLNAFRQTRDEIKEWIARTF
jgi:arsenate reductase